MAREIHRGARHDTCACLEPRVLDHRLPSTTAPSLLTSTVSRNIRLPRDPNLHRSRHGRRSTLVGPIRRNRLAASSGTPSCLFAGNCQLNRRRKKGIYPVQAYWLCSVRQASIQQSRQKGISETVVLAPASIRCETFAAFLAHQSDTGTLSTRNQNPTEIVADNCRKTFHIADPPGWNEPPAGCCDPWRSKWRAITVPRASSLR